MHVTIRHEFVHHVGERAAGTQFNNLGNVGSAARLHAGSPVNRLLDLARQLVRARPHVEHRVTVYPTQQPDTGRHLRGEVRPSQRLPKLVARIGKERRMRWNRHR